MGNHRTGGMTTIGILNIIFGALFSLVFLLMILGAGFMTAAGSAMGGEDGAAVAAGGGFLMLVGIAAFAINLMLFISGFGVLKVAPWGRSLSVACGGLGIVVYAASLVGAGFSIATLGMLGYCVLLVGLFFTPNWKNAFSSSESAQPTADSASVAPDTSHVAAPEASDFDETREAA